MTFSIVDDDKAFARHLQQVITSICGKYGYEVTILCFENADAIFAEDTFLNFDAIFLDIEMPDTDGISLAEKINSKKKDSSVPFIVFVTSKEHMVFEALKKLPYSFIRKSHLDDLEDCVLSICKNLIISPKYSIKEGRDVFTIEIKKIIYIEKQRNYTLIFTENGIFTERSTIDEKQADLTPYHFLRTSVSTLVNPEHIVKFENNEVLMSDNHTVSVSRSYKKAFKVNLHRWIRR